MPTHTLSAKHHRLATFTDRARERLAFDNFGTATELARSLHRKIRVRGKAHHATRSSAERRSTKDRRL
jgi:hypothetical protein